MIKTKWFRNCVECDDTIFYKNKQSFTCVLYRIKSGMSKGLCNKCKIKSQANSIKGRIPWNKDKHVFLDNLIGKTFNHWLVVSFIRKQRVPIWICKCLKCNKLVDVRACDLKSGKSKSCGSCGKRKRPYEFLYNLVIRRSKEKNIYCDLSYEQFIEFTKIDKCHYCDDSIKWVQYTSNKEINQKLGYNLDRKDNNIGYTKDNCVVCCGGCNRTKGDRFSYNEFLLIGKLIKQIKENRKNDSIR